MKKSSLRKKAVLAISVAFTVFVIFSIVVSYIFYSDAISMSDSEYLSSSKTQFFIILACAEILMAVIIVALMLYLVEVFIVNPLEKMSDAIDGVFVQGNDGNYIEISEENDSKLKDLDIKSNDEIEELYLNMLKMQSDMNDCIDSLKEDNWEAEHDSMTMLSNRKRFNKRKDMVYPKADSIFIACVDVINLRLVNEKLSVEAGDSIISKVARELRRLSSDSIHTYRFEEDNFIIVMCGYNEEDAKGIIDKWNSRVGRLNRVTDNFDCMLVWGGSYGENDFVVDDVLKRADAEMYCQKMVVKNELGQV